MLATPTENGKKANIGASLGESPTNTKRSRSASRSRANSAETTEKAVDMPISTAVHHVVSGDANKGGGREDAFADRATGGQNIVERLALAQSAAERHVAAPMQRW